MPIRFRCAYCNQLLGIARRKAGTVVRCPSCSGQVVVPSLEEAGLADKPGPVPQRTGSSAQAFEGNEIDKVLEGAAGEQPSVVQPGYGPVFASQRAREAPPPLIGSQGPLPPGVYLSPQRATLLSVFAVVALAISFGLGLLLGLVLGGKN